MLSEILQCTRLIDSIQMEYFGFIDMLPTVGGMKTDKTALCFCCVTTDKGSVEHETESYVITFVLLF